MEDSELKRSPKCHGIGLSVLGGFLPYISLFAGFYSFTMQFYIGPRDLYKAKES